MLILVVLAASRGLSLDWQTVSPESQVMSQAKLDAIRVRLEQSTAAGVKH